MDKCFNLVSKINKKGLFTNRLIILALSVIFFLAISVSSVFGATVTYSGHVYNVTGHAITGTNVSIEIWQESPTFSVNSTYSTLSDSSGYWIVSFDDSGLPTTYMVKFIPRNYTGDGYVDLIGGILPPFPSTELDVMLSTSAVDFYLKEGATINITALNQTSDGPINFTYMVKDTKLGFPIESDWTTAVTQKTIYLPADRNYSIQIFPFQSMPIYYDLNNLSDYSAPKHVDIIFNTTSAPIRVTGRINLTSSGNGTDFQEFNIINYLLEPGDMVFAGMSMPYNMSAWSGQSDVFNKTHGIYNISLEGTAMTTHILMVVIAKHEGTYYAGFRNITPTIGNNVAGFNFTLFPLLGSLANISIETATGGRINITANQTTFAFANSTQYLTTATGHLEIEVEYSNVDSDFPDFTWMVDVASSDNGTFTLPLLNYGVKKLNMFTQNYAPLKRPYTIAELNIPQVNISLTPFNPGAIGGEAMALNISMYKSSSECDVPNPDSSCVLVDSQAQADFKPLNAIISGGAISFRMISSTGITVHYKNVDMIASGPPDVSMDSNANASEAGSSLEDAWRFGSKGPEIYDEVLIGIPYNESKYDEAQAFTLTIDKLYDKVYDGTWRQVWDVDVNGSVLSAITGNFSDYNGFDASYFIGLNCSKTDITQRCFINTSTNMVWLTIPHFSGLGPQVGGYATLGNITSDKTVYQCYPNCIALVNVTITNLGLNGTQSITINNTADESGMEFKIHHYNNTDGSWYYAGDANTNHTGITNINLTFHTQTPRSNMFMINITMTTPVSTKWNFSFYINGTPYTLDPYLDAINLTTVNASSIADSTPDLTYVLYSDNWTKQSCNLTINNTVYINSSVGNGSMVTTTINNSLSDASYAWSVTCNVTGTSQTQYITVAEPPTVTINAPVANANLSGVTTLNATVINGVAVDVVFFAVSNSTGYFWNRTTTNLSGNYYVNTTFNTSALADGLYNVTVYSNDTSGNSNNSERNPFTIDNTVPVVLLTSPSNYSNMTTTSTAAMFNVSDATSEVRYLQFYTSCDGTIRTFTNATAFYPFNYSGCTNTNGTYTLTINVTDWAGNSNSTTYLYKVDDVAPSFSSVVLINSSIAEVNITWVTSDFLRVTNIGYYLDDEAYTALSTTGSSTILKNFSAGVHSIIFTANDSVGNRGNSSSYSITVVKLVDMTSYSTGLRGLQTREISYANVTFFPNGTVADGQFNISQNFTVLITTNASGANLNVTLAGFDGRNANWGKNFSIHSNNGSSTGLAIAGNWSSKVEYMVYFNSSLDDFLPDTNNYYGTVILPVNVSSRSSYKVIWFDSETDLTTNTTLSACSGAGSSTPYLITTSTPCYNVTAAAKTIAYVPHFSVVALLNDTTAPTVTINKPNATQTTASFYFNFTTSLDATGCYFNITYSNSSSYSSAVNNTAVPGTLSTVGGIKYCISLDVIHFKNGANGENYKLTAYVNDSVNNMNISILEFNVTDSTTPTTTFNSTANVTGITTSVATITWVSSEYTNASVAYGASKTTMTNHEGGTAFGNSKTKSVSLTGLSAETPYYFNLTTCDRAGNCNATDGIYNFTTAATAAEDEDEEAASTGGGGGAGAVSIIAKKAAQFWSSIEAGTSAVMTVTEEEIPVTKLTVDIVNTVTNAELSVASLTKAPTTEIVLNETVYKYLEITKKNIKDEDISKAKIEFTVTKLWLTENGINEDDVILARYNGEWKELTTTKISSTATIVTYEAEAAGLSYFAITTKEAVEAQVPAGEVPEEAPPEEVPEEEAPPEEVPEEAPPEEVPEEKPKTWLWILLLAIVVVVGVGYYLYAAKKK